MTVGGRKGTDTTVARARQPAPEFDAHRGTGGVLGRCGAALRRRRGMGGPKRQDRAFVGRAGRNV